MQAYSDSKLVNLAYGYAIAARLGGTGVTVNAADPGNVATGFGRRAGGLLKVVQGVGRLFMDRPEKGARTSVRLAADPALDGATGGYYSAARQSVSSEASRDPAFGEWVHDRTAAVLARVVG